MKLKVVLITFREWQESVFDLNIAWLAYLTLLYLLIFQIQIIFLLIPLYYLFICLTHRSLTKFRPTLAVYGWRHPLVLWILLVFDYKPKREFRLFSMRVIFIHGISLSSLAQYSCQNRYLCFQNLRHHIT